MLEIIRNRRSVRQFTSDPVTQEQVETLLEAGIMAPSAMNKQPWHFIVCRDREMMERFQTVHPYSKMLSQAPVMILVCGDTQKQPGPHFYQQDCAACTENILLAAQAMGLGGCWLGIPPQSEREEQIAALFGLPEHIKPFCGIALGVPSVQPPQAELAYYMLFTLFPLVIFSNVLVSSFHLSVEEIMENLSLLLPEQIVSLITEYIGYITNLQPGTLMYAGSVLTVYFTSRAVNSLMLSIGVAYRQPRKGKLNFFFSVIVTVVVLLSMYLLLGLVLISENLLALAARVLPIPVFLVRIWNWLRFTAMPVYLFCIITLFYKIAPAKWLRFLQAAPGGLFFVAVWSAISYFFSYYVSNLANYSVLYGSLGAVMILMLWFYMTGIILILGGHLNHIVLVLRQEKKIRKRNGE